MTVAKSASMLTERGRFTGRRRNELRLLLLVFTSAVKGKTFEGSFMNELEQSKKCKLCSMLDQVPNNYGKF